jgi:hypothetical protein
MPTGAPLQVGATISVDELNRELAALRGRVSDLRPVFEAVDRDMSLLLRKQFESHGARLGTPWAPLSEATRAVRSALGQGSLPLRATGAMYQSFLSPGAHGFLRTFDALTYVRGSSYAPGGVPVAALVQAGFNSVTMPVFDAHGVPLFIRRPNGPKPVPGRTIIPENMPAPVMRAWEGYVEQYINTGEVVGGMVS